jgi:hypothetical protein
MQPRRPRTCRTWGALLCAAALAAVSACGPAVVELETSDLSPSDEAACEAVLDDLPDRLGERERRPVEPASALGAAWGDPAVVLSCGVRPPDLEPTAVCQEADGVGWYVDDAALEDDSVDVVMSTAGYRPAVEVVVPAEARPEGVAAAMAGLAEAVSQRTELVRPCL